MKVTRILVVAAITTCFLTSCEDEQARSRIAELEAYNKTLVQYLHEKEASDKNVIDLLNEQEERQDSQLASLTKTVQRIETKEKTAIVDLNSREYSVLDTGQGVLLVSCDGAEQYLDGHRVKLRIGNPLYMRISGFKLKFRFGRKRPEIPIEEDMKTDFQKVAEKFRKDYETWEASLRRSEQSFTDDLLPGAWNAVQATLAQTKPDDLAYVEVGIETDRISLSKAMKP